MKRFRRILWLGFLWAIKAAVCAAAFVAYLIAVLWLCDAGG